MRARIIIPLAALLTLGAAFGAQKFRAYVSSDARFCATCHQASPEFALWNSGGHSRIACQKCHHATPAQGVSMLSAFLLGRQPGSGGHGSVEIGSCAACHLSHDRAWVQVGASRGHRIHALEQKIACIRCHGAAVHRFEPVVQSCRECHGEHMVNLKGMQRLHCFACHDFLSVDTDLRPSRRDCLRCHQAEGLSAQSFPEDAPMRFTCSGCHKPHQARALIECASCHDRMATAGLHRLPSHRECGACHRPHSWISDRNECLRCHRTAPAHAGALTCPSCHSFRGAPAPAVRLGGN
ncbi:MAG TPA: hypothetical protein VFP52_00780 [Myxococcales bacterium]|nr:hypothetical protein [Myxococcales bacterium]